MKLLLEILRMLKEIAGTKIPFSVIWQYEVDDLDTLELGKELEKILDLKFKLQVK